MGLIRNYRELDVYQHAMDLTMTIFELTRTFPAEEKYSLTSQIRRSSRSVCSNLAEAWRKRRYLGAFISKLSDSEGEAAETQVQTEIAWRCGYLNEQTFRRLDDHYDRVMGQIVRMIEHPEKWLIRRPAQGGIGEGGSRGAGEAESRRGGEPGRRRAGDRLSDQLAALPPRPTPDSAP